VSRARGVPCGSTHLANLRQGLADRRCRILALMFWVAEALDMLSTADAIEHRGLAEGNPLFAPLLTRHLLLALALKAGIVVLVTLGALAGLQGRLRLLVLRVYVVIGLVVVAGNAHAIGWP
jgi:hypothetical protein